MFQFRSGDGRGWEISRRGSGKVVIVKRKGLGQLKIKLNSNKDSLRYLVLQGVTQDKTTKIYFLPFMVDAVPSGEKCQNSRTTE